RSETVTVTVTVEPREGGTLDLAATADTRCVVGRVVQTVRVSNDDDVPVTVTVSSPYGERETTLRAGRAASFALTTRQADIDEGRASVTGEATRAGDLVSDSLTVEYDARSCGRPDGPGGREPCPTHPGRRATATHDATSPWRRSYAGGQAATVASIRSSSVCSSPGASSTRSVPELKASGGQVIGSTATPRRPTSSPP